MNSVIIKLKTNINQEVGITAMDYSREQHCLALELIPQPKMGCCFLSRVVKLLKNLTIFSVNANFLCCFLGKDG